MALDAEVAADLKILVNAVTERALGLRWAYYSGEHPKVYVTPKLRKTFRNLADSFDENYCGLAVNSRLARLEVTGWQGPNAEEAQAIWDRSKLGRRQTRLFRYAIVHSRAVLIADPDAEGGPALRVNKATIAYGHPHDDDPDVLRFIGKVWESEGAWRATLMYADESIRLVSPPGARLTDSTRFQVDEEDPGGPNPLPTNLVPGVVVSPYDEAEPLVDSITGLQNRINKMAANKFVAAEFGAFKQRVFFTRQQVTPFDVQNAPDHAIILDPGEAEAAARVQELSATELRNYDQSKDSEVDSLFTIATLPRHMRVNPGASPSGEAVKADEGPFVESVRGLQNQIGEALIEAMELFGLDAEPVWRDPTVHNEGTQADTVTKMVDSGVPLRDALMRYAGWSEEEVDAALSAAAAASPTGTGVGDQVGAALLSAFNAPGVPGVVPEV